MYSQKPYMPSDWYWFVAGDTSRVYSSSRLQYVSLDDQGYQSFLASGGVTSTNPSEGDLIDVLTQAIGADIQQLEEQPA